MAPHSKPKYGNLVVIVYKCGLRITKELLFKNIKKLTPDDQDPDQYTIDHFLYDKKKAILKHKCGKDKERILFPGFNKTTDIDRWDLTIVFFLLIHFCKLDESVKHEINSLRHLRNELAHPKEEDIDITDSIYQQKLERIEGIINRCSNLIGSPDLKVELDSFIKETDRTHSADIDVKEKEAKLKEWLEDERSAQLHISDTIKDVKAFTNLTDDILQQIQRSNDQNLEKSRAIINRIVDRDFYKCIVQTQVDVKKNGWMVNEKVRENLFNKINSRLGKPRDLSKIIEIDVVNLDYGSKEKDPITKVWFFKKRQEEKAIRISKDQVSFVLPDTFAEQYIRVYCSVTDPELFDIVEKSFSEWCKENDVPQPKIKITLKRILIQIIHINMKHTNTGIISLAI